MPQEDLSQGRPDVYCSGCGCFKDCCICRYEHKGTAITNAGRLKKREENLDAITDQLHSNIDRLREWYSEGLQRERELNAKWQVIEAVEGWLKQHPGASEELFKLIEEEKTNKFMGEKEA